MAQVIIEGVAFPPPSSMAESDEQLWSEDTGRTLTGQMVGDVTAIKHKLSITWEFLWADKVAIITNGLRRGFFTISYPCETGTRSIVVYKGTVAKEYCLEQNSTGKILYKNVSVELVER